MCIIVIKPKGRSLPSRQTLENCFWSNPDGAGFMYSYGNQTVISKGYFDFESLWHELQKISDVKDKDLVVHFRIATSGTITPENTHPYPLVTDINQLRRLDTTSNNGGLCHNGILPKGAFDKKDLKSHSDTMLLVRDCLATLPQGPALDKTIEIIAQATGSRLVLLNGKLRKYGSGWLEENGCFFSNSSYEDFGGYVVISGYRQTNIDDWRHYVDPAEICPLCQSEDSEPVGHTCWYCPGCGTIWEWDKLAKCDLCNYPSHNGILTYDHDGFMVCPECYKESE